MKITFNPNVVTLKRETQCGVISSASYARIVRAMVAAGELKLYPGEEVAGITVGAEGLSFRIEKK